MCYYFGGTGSCSLPSARIMPVSTQAVFQPWWQARLENLAVEFGEEAAEVVAAWLHSVS